MIGCTNQRRVFDKFIQVGDCLKQLNAHYQQLQSMHLHHTNYFNQGFIPTGNFMNPPQQNIPNYLHQQQTFPIRVCQQRFPINDFINPINPPSQSTFVINNYYSNKDVSFDEEVSDESSETSDSSSDEPSVEISMTLS